MTMNIQIFGTNKSFDTKKAQRWFKERGIKFQMIDMKEKGMSAASSTMSAAPSAGGRSLSMRAQRTRTRWHCCNGWTKASRRTSCLRTSSSSASIVRNGRLATVGYCPDVWEKWA